MDDLRVDSIRNILGDFVSADKGETLREELALIASVNYIPAYDCDSYMRYMNKHECSFNKNHPQSTNHPYVWTMFSVPSQHIMGDCIEECLDKAIFKSRWDQ